MDDFEINIIIKNYHVPAFGKNTLKCFFRVCAAKILTVKHWLDGERRDKTC